MPLVNMLVKAAVQRDHPWTACRLQPARASTTFPSDSPNGPNTDPISRRTWPNGFRRILTYLQTIKWLDFELIPGYLGESREDIHSED